MYVVYMRGGSTAKAVRLLFSEEAAHLAASPDPASDPKASVLTLVVRKTLVGKSLGDTHWPYLLFSLWLLPEWE